MYRLPWLLTGDAQQVHSTLNELFKDNHSVSIRSGGKIYFFRITDLQLNILIHNRFIGGVIDVFSVFGTFDLYVDLGRALKLKKYLFYTFFVNFHRSWQIIASFVDLN